ncbi:methyltransferase [Synechococcus sp. CCY9201]|uniref:class I SAM-dependent methyltransferase n=1 Tax=Synechococcus sp. CCY9201 TaxID=174697 RepID=UPI002B1F095C|nr:methyltransferase [Synechococcus sp. CCY9201]MEA5474339.1 methyltransferase [Synechococcus sp. CCY9201]
MGFLISTTGTEWIASRVYRQTPQHKLRKQHSISLHQQHPKPQQEMPNNRNLPSLRGLTKSILDKPIQQLAALKRHLLGADTLPLSPSLGADGGVQASYVKGALKKIHAGRPHASLGGNISEKFKRKALTCFQYLTKQGITPDDVVVDYGCGTLRIGKHFIEYLEKGHYVGMDLDRRILDAGLSQLPHEKVEAKTPRLELIDDESIDRVATLNPSLVFAKGVLQHVPPAQLNRFFSNLAKLGAHGTIIVVIKIASTSKRLSNRSWSYTANDVLAAAGKVNLKLVGVERVWHHFRS